ncbi:uncharacterized protein LOC134610450 isoform X1 [Pelobates fuscus]|uniref:uncharacterized protein LOC134610450 isoform X1 n=2 Tax=Pelobates fuscus TaxID=191477 RepID=UPI002FE4940F
MEEKIAKKRAKRLHMEHERENIITSGKLFIDVFLGILGKTNATPEVCTKYLKKVLHAIFFLGHINKPQILPEDFIPDHLQGNLRIRCPEIFEQCKTHLARQTPYSILLEFMAENDNVKDPQNFISQLANVNSSLWKMDRTIGSHPVANDFAFTAYIIAYSCYRDARTNGILKIAYGSSMSCKGKIPRQIMIRISALYKWDKAISYAVCRHRNSPAIMFPNQVQCETFSFQAQKCNFRRIPSCTDCEKLFKNEQPDPLSITDKEICLYGSLAETESVSNLLMCCPDLRNTTVSEQFNNQNPMNREEIEHIFTTEYQQQLISELRSLLNSRDFTLPEGEWLFYNPV